VTGRVELELLATICDGARLEYGFALPEALRGILGLKTLIDQDAEIPDYLRSEMKDKANYPLCGKFGMYLSNFKPKMDDATYNRLKTLCQNGLDCELIEYDTVINQMMLWCFLYNIGSDNAVYRQLRPWPRSHTIIARSTGRRSDGS
jgi:hypothetical protein